MHGWISFILWCFARFPQKISGLTICKSTITVFPLQALPLMHNRLVLTLTAVPITTLYSSLSLRFYCLETCVEVGMLMLMSMWSRATLMLTSSGVTRPEAACLRVFWTPLACAEIEKWEHVLFENTIQIEFRSHGQKHGIKLRHHQQFWLSVESRISSTNSRQMCCYMCWL